MNFVAIKMLASWVYSFITDFSLPDIWVVNLIVARVGGDDVAVERSRMKGDLLHAINC
ncbi:MAG TPA: hypothetical protein VLZ12_09870 [Verrucomicrobiae bacterium]|nr:hypothetical protein [Verrucomicrobiae bacterium]